MRCRKEVDVVAGGGFINTGGGAHAVTATVVKGGAAGSDIDRGGPCAAL